MKAEMKCRNISDTGKQITVNKVEFKVSSAELIPRDVQNTLSYSEIRK